MIQVLLLLAALIAVPCMLLPKPLVLRKRFMKRQAEVSVTALMTVYILRNVNDDVIKGSHNDGDTAAKYLTKRRLDSRVQHASGVQKLFPALVKLARVLVCSCAQTFSCSSCMTKKSCIKLRRNQVVYTGKLCSMLCDFCGISPGSSGSVLWWHPDSGG